MPRFVTVSHARRGEKVMRHFGFIVLGIFRLCREMVHIHRQAQKEEKGKAARKARESGKESRTRHLKVTPGPLSWPFLPSLPCGLARRGMVLNCPRKV